MPRRPRRRQLAKVGKIWMLGRKPWRIDVLTQIDGVTFPEVWRGRVEAAFVSASLPAIGLAELLRNKRAAGRPKDLSDVASLEAHHTIRRLKPQASKKRVKGRVRRRQR